MQKNLNLEELEQWKIYVRLVGFTEYVRCKDPALLRKIKALRTTIPDRAMFRDICRGHRAWKTDEPDGKDIADLFERVARRKNAAGEPMRTTIVTCTRRAAAIASDLALSVLFRNRNKPHLGEADLSWESNLDNYEDTGELKKES